MAVLEMDSVTLCWGERTVLSDVYLRCETGRVTGLLGRNGSGKSCLLNILYGMLEPQSKSVRFNGRAWLSKRRDPRCIRYLPQFGFIPKSLTPRKALTDFSLGADAFVAWFPGFEKLLDSPLGRLSGGERRTVEVYCILACRTEFSVLDEPFAQLTPLCRNRFRELIAQQKRSRGILLSDHLYREVTEISDDVYFVGDTCVRPVRSPDDLERFGYVPRRAIDGQNGDGSGR